MVSLLMLISFYPSFYLEDYVFSDSFSRNFSFEVFILGRVVVLEFDQAIWLHVVGDLYVVCLDSKF